MAHNFYAVKRGFDKEKNIEVYDKVFDSWKDVSPLVRGYDNARFKGFDTIEEATTWLEVVDKTDAVKRAKATQSKIMREITGKDTFIDQKDALQNTDELLEKMKETVKYLSEVKGYSNLIIKGILATLCETATNQNWR